MTDKEKDAQSTKVFDRVAMHPRFVCARTILLYYSLPDEVSTHTFIKQWADGKRVILPAVNGGMLDLHEFVSAEAMRIGAYGIAEPDGQTFQSIGEIDLVIVPGRAFDRKGNRLGRGGGYYDRLLCQSGLVDKYKIGISFDCQIVERIPSTSQDVVMDEVLTASYQIK